jgi:predicted Zn-ribbon and HTH transcriptional regulator
VSERHVTIRSELRRVLGEGPLTARELSARVGISEKEVAGHLAHLARSLRQRGEQLRVEPPRCLACGFVFKERTRLDKPSRCPECKSERLAPSRFAIAGGPHKVILSPGG